MIAFLILLSGCQKPETVTIDARDVVWTVPPLTDDSIRTYGMDDLANADIDIRALKGAYASDRLTEVTVEPLERWRFVLEDGEKFEYTNAQGVLVHDQKAGWIKRGEEISRDTVLAYHGWLPSTYKDGNVVADVRQNSQIRRYKVSLTNRVYYVNENDLLLLHENTTLDSVTYVGEVGDDGNPLPKVTIRSNF